MFAIQVQEHLVDIVIFVVPGVRMSLRTNDVCLFEIKRPFAFL
jgi:hypothetical protein